MKRQPPRELSLSRIGWKEYVDLPDWGIHGVVAKIDSGARTSSLHVTNVQPVGEGEIEFDVVVDRADPAQNVRVRAPIVRRAFVRPSTGRIQERYVVATRLHLGNDEHVVELTLVNREKMRCRMLIGRRALEDHYMVDPGRTYIYGKKRRPRP